MGNIYSATNQPPPENRTGGSPPQDPEDPFPRPLKGSSYISPTIKSAIEGGRNHIRMGAMKFAEAVVAIAGGQTLDGQPVDPRIQLEANIWLLERIYGKNVQPLVAVIEDKKDNPEQIAAILAKHNMAHLLPPEREIIDEPNANPPASQ